MNAGIITWVVYCLCFQYEPTNLHGQERINYLLGVNKLSGFVAHKLDSVALAEEATLTVN